jgi:hypothetical protein
MESLIRLIAGDSGSSTHFPNSIGPKRSRQWKAPTRIETWSKQTERRRRRRRPKSNSKNEETPKTH